MIINDVNGQQIETHKKQALCVQKRQRFSIFCCETGRNAVEGLRRATGLFGAFKRSLTCLLFYGVFMSPAMATRCHFGLSATLAQVPARPLMYPYHSLCVGPKAARSPGQGRERPATRAAGAQGAPPTAPQDGACPPHDHAPRRAGAWTSQHRRSPGRGAVASQDAEWYRGAWRAAGVRHARRETGLRQGA